ncbi:MAG: hypothetical protein IJA75_00015, partial [Oscillospiraceae bacterium]|nr:hypothetical protein [Oscillospiraceae bacterium]
QVKLNAENGARGISNKVEECLVNLLPAVLIEHEAGDGDTIHIENLENQRLTVTVTKKQPATNA